MINYIYQKMTGKINKNQKQYWRIISVFFLFCFAVAGPLHSQSAGKKTTLEWKAVENASGYQVQIQDTNKKIVFNQKTRENKIQVQIKPGDYKFRIGALNKFFKLSLWSDWIELKISKPILPVLNSISPDSVPGDNKIQKVVLKGENFYDFTRVNMKSLKEKIPIKKKEFIDSETIEITLDISKAKPGRYTLELINPGNKLLRKENIFSIEPPVKPKIEQNFGPNFLTLGVIPQILLFSRQSLNSILRTNRAITMDIYLDRFSLYSITPGMRIGYFSMQSTKEKELNVELAGYRVDAFLSYPVINLSRFILQAGIGSGLSFVGLEASYARANGNREQFREVNFFLNLDLRYKLFHFLSLMAGIEFFNLADSRGSVSLFVPRVGILAVF